MWFPLMWGSRVLFLPLMQAVKAGTISATKLISKQAAGKSRVYIYIQVFMITFQVPFLSSLLSLFISSNLENQNQEVLSLVHKSLEKFLVLQRRLANQRKVSSLLTRALLFACLWGAPIHVCSVENIFLQTSHLSSFHRYSPAPVSICCSSSYLCATCWRSPSTKPLGFYQKKMLALLLTWCILPSLVPSFTGRFNTPKQS